MSGAGNTETSRRVTMPPEEKTAPPPVIEVQTKILVNGRYISLEHAEKVWLDLGRALGKDMISQHLPMGMTPPYFPDIDDLDDLDVRALLTENSPLRSLLVQIPQVRTVLAAVTAGRSIVGLGKELGKEVKDVVGTIRD